MNQKPRTTNYRAYEAAFAEKLGEGAIAFAFWKGRVALESTLRAFGLSAGDEVIMPGFTCVVVPDAVRRVGAVPVFADIEAQGYNADLAQVESLVTLKTRAVICQHTFGIVADLGSLVALCERHGLLLIEDSCHALGSYYQGKHVGLVGHAGFFSLEAASAAADCLCHSAPELRAWLPGRAVQVLEPVGR